MRERFFSLLTCILLLACNDSNKEVKAQRLKNDYPAYSIKGYMDGIMIKRKDGFQAMLASCLIEKVQQKFTYNQYQNILEKTGQDYDDYKEFFKQVSQQCIEEIKTNQYVNRVHKNDTHDYPAYVLKGFIDGCMEQKYDGEQAILCSCLFEKIQQKYTLEEYERITKMEGRYFNNYQDFLQQATKECISNTKNKN